MNWQPVNVLVEGPEDDQVRKGHVSQCGCGSVQWNLFYMQDPWQLHVQCVECGRVTCLHPEPCCDYETWIPTDPDETDTPGYLIV